MIQIPQDIVTRTAFMLYGIGDWDWSKPPEHDCQIVLKLVYLENVFSDGARIQHNVGVDLIWKSRQVFGEVWMRFYQYEIEHAKNKWKMKQLNGDIL
jgi:hypothetical protein